MLRRSPFARFVKKPKPPKGKRRKLEEMTRGELEHLLDSELSLYVRMNAAIEIGLDTIPCYTCGAPHPWKDMDAGHYVGRANRGVRWDLRNIRPQCTKCNSFQEGMHWVFRRNLVIELGEKAVESLEQTAGMWGECRRDRLWIIEQIKDWRTKNKELRRKL